MFRPRPLLLLASVALLAGCTSSAQPSVLEQQQAPPPDLTQQEAQTSVLAQPAEPQQAGAQRSGQETVVASSEGITVSGVGRISGRPDVLRVTIGVEAIRPTVQEALDAANAGASQIIEVLRESGVAEEDIQTRDLAVYPQYGERPSATPQITAYSVSNLVEAAVRDLDSAGEVIGQAIRAGGDDARLHQVAFALEDNEALLDDARERAFADARRKAEQYAQMAGGSLGRLVSVREVTGTPPQPIPFAAGGAEAADSAVPIEPGTQEVSVQVTATWVLG